MTLRRTVVALGAVPLVTFGAARLSLAIADHLEPGLVASARGATSVGLGIDGGSVAAFLGLVWWWLDPMLLRRGLGRPLRLVLTTLVPALLVLGAFPLPICYVGFFAMLGKAGASNALMVLETLAAAPVVGWVVAFWLVELVGGLPRAHVELRAERARRRRAVRDRHLPPRSALPTHGLGAE